MEAHVRWWGDEVYADPHDVCAPTASLSSQAAQFDAFAMHLPALATTGPAAAATARHFLNNHFVPTLNGTFRSPGYQTAGLSLDQVEHFVSTQIYATRQWAENHPYPGWRIGLAWTYDKTHVTASDSQLLAQRIASALHGAYNPGVGTSLGACGSMNSWCQCGVPGGNFNDLWTAFANW
jgi:hypothetical protein